MTKPPTKRIDQHLDAARGKLAAAVAAIVSDGEAERSEPRIDAARRAVVELAAELDALDRRREKRQRTRIYKHRQRETGQLCDLTPVVVSTFSGRLVDLVEPLADAIRLDDLAISLGRLARYNGHTKFFYSVAEHSVHVAELARVRGLGPRVTMRALLHDAHEAIIGDLVTPVARILGEGAKLERLKMNLDAAIAEALDVPPPDEQTAAIVERLDAAMLASEISQLCRGGWREPFLSELAATRGAEPAALPGGQPWPLACWGHTRAYHEYIDAFERARLELAHAEVIDAENLRA